MRLTKVLGFVMVVWFLMDGTVIGVPWPTLSLPMQLLDGVVLLIGIGLVVGAEYFERTHPELFSKNPKK